MSEDAEREVRFFGVDPPEQLFELSDQVRRVIDQMIRVDRNSPELAAIRDEARALAERLERIARSGALPRMRPEVEPGPDDLRPYYPSDARRWHVNPMHPPLELRHDPDGALTGRVTLGLAWEGPPGCVHGGFVAMLFDQILGHANVANGIPAMTGELRVRYHRPTPLHVPLVFEVAAAVRESERRVRTRGVLRAGDEITAEATGIFVTPRVDRVDLAIEPASFGREGAESE
ncbi:MAG: PaaI family thioesterase [Myxococcales bacterium]|nr:PaaI family thioesterase [Myxococcales bacterium]